MNRVRAFLLRGRRPRSLDAEAGYDIWSSTYDSEPDNLLVAMDDVIFPDLLDRVGVRGKVVVDVGCGTGRHWARLLAGHPARLLGFDVSPRMLAKLVGKYPDAVVERVSDHRLGALPSASCDLLVSTLALCHMPNAAAALAEWARVVRPGGDLIITDLHPRAAARSDCTFRHQGRVESIALHVHSMASLVQAAAQHRLSIERLEERVVEASLKPLYEAHNARAAFARMEGVPLILGLHLKQEGPPGS